MSDRPDHVLRDGSASEGELFRIGTVAHRIGLSLRTIRHYEEVGVVIPARRSAGGFRLYSEQNVADLRLVKQMKPLEFSLEQMRDLLTTLHALTGDDGSDPDRGAVLRERVAMYRSIVDARIAALRQQLDRAEDFATLLRAPG